MGSQESNIELKGRIMSINAHYQLAKQFDYRTGSQMPELSPDLVMVSISNPTGPYYTDSNHAGNFIIKTSDAKKLHLMVGEIVTITIAKSANENQD